jgi:predicted PurR-regulated permease PerM
VALVPVLTFYFLRDWDVMVAQIRDLLPRPYLPTVTRLAREADLVLGSFLRGQFSVMLSLGAIYRHRLYAHRARPRAVDRLHRRHGQLRALPRRLRRRQRAVLATLVQHGDALHLLLVLGVFALGQTMEGFVLVPWLVGDRIGLHPVAVIFAIMAGGQLFGFLGVLLALPVAAVSMVLLRHAHEQYRRSGLYGGPGQDPEAVAEEAPEAESRELPPPPDTSASLDPPAPYPEP